MDRANLVRIAKANGVSEETIQAIMRSYIPIDLYSVGGEQLPSPEFSLEELEQAEEIMKTVSNNR